MQLRRTAGRAGVHIGLAMIVAALAVSPAALAVAEKPKPDALWKAFPLDPASKRPASPASKRPASPLLPPAQERAEARAEATTFTEQPSEATRENYLVLALATLVVLLSTVVILSGRRLFARRDQRASVPLWQGLAWPHSPNNVRQLHQSGVRTSSALVGRERRAEPHPDVAVPRYRWADKTPGRRPRPLSGAEIGVMIHRLRRVVWTEDTVPAIIGAGVAVIVGVLLVYLIG